MEAVEWPEFFKFLAMLSIVLLFVGVFICAVYEYMLDSKNKKEVERLEALRKNRLTGM